MWKEEIEQVRSKSQAGNSGPWNDPVFYPEMAVKTVVHHHSKALPLSSKARRTIERGGELLDGAETRAPRAVVTDEPMAELVYNPASPMENLSTAPARSVDAVVGAMARGEPVQQPATRRRRRQEPATEGAAQQNPAPAGGASGFGITYTPAGAGAAGGGAHEGTASGSGASSDTNGNDRIILRDPDGTTYYKDTGEIIEYGRAKADGPADEALRQSDLEKADRARNESREAAAAKAVTGGAAPQQGVMAAMRELMDSQQPSNREEYIAWVTTKWEYADTDDKVEALRQWWGLTGGTRTQFNVTQADAKAMADKMRRVQPA